MRLPALIAITVAGCSSTTATIPPQQATDLQTSRARWQVSGIRDYRYVMHTSGGLCSSPGLLINVLRDRVASVEYADSGRDCHSRKPYGKGRDASPILAERAQTMDEILAGLGQCRRDCAVVSASFHPSHGFPVAFHMEPLLEVGTTMEDASYRARISAFEIR